MRVTQRKVVGVSRGNTLRGNRAHSSESEMTLSHERAENVSERVPV